MSAPTKRPATSEILPRCRKRSRTQHKFEVVVTESDFNRRYERDEGSPIVSRDTQTAEVMAHIQQQTERAWASCNTPMKAGGSQHPGAGTTTRQALQEQMVNHVAGCRWISDDLVEHVFGEVVSTPEAAVALLALLRYGLITVKPISDSTPLGPDVPSESLWVDACADAAGASSDHSHQASKYEWTWKLPTGQEHEAALFLNIIAVLGARAARRQDTIKNLWTTRFEPSRPFIGYFGEDARPDITCISRAAFRKSDQPALGRRHAIDPSMLSHLQKYSIPTDSSPAIQTASPPPSPTAPSSTSTSTTATRDQLVNMLRTALQEPLPQLDLYQEFSYNGVNTDFICWEGFASTGEVNTANLLAAIPQSMFYMEQQRLAQPHLQFVIGLALTGRDFTLTRADGMGVEHATLDMTKDSGAFEIVRAAMGFALADDPTLGCSPDFELREKTYWRFATQDQKTEALVKRDRPDIGPATRVRKREFEDVHTMKTAKCPVFYNTPPDENGKRERYYLDYLADNRGSLVGRSTRVWCAYRQITKNDLDSVDVRDRDTAKEALRAKEEVFVGPFALKIQNLVIDSAASLNSLHTDIKKAVEKDLQEADDKIKTGAACILAPLQVYDSTDIMKKIRGFTDSIPTAIQGTLRRREIVSVSLFKRTLRQYESFAEVARAAIDAFRGIEWLRSHGWLHRDISDGNILLAKEDPSTFNEVFSPEPGIVLCRRPISSTPEIYGLLHDFDMAGLVDPPLGDQAPNFAHAQTGTPPFMSISTLLGNTKQHRVVDDVQSVFHVLYLFPFSNGAPLPASYPKALPPFLDVSWPEPIRQWAYGDNLEVLGAVKQAFFQTRRKWHPDKNAVLRAPPSANQESHLDRHWPRESPQFILWERFITELHDRWLWGRQEADEELWFSKTKLESVLDLVEAMQRMLGTAPTFPAQNINYVPIQTLDA